MKKIVDLKKSTLFYLFVAITCLAALQSCRKTDPGKNPLDASVMIKLVNASPDAGTVQLYSDGDVRVKEAVASGASSAYNGCFSGDQEITVRSSNGVTLARLSIALDVFGYYSFYLTGTTGNYTIVPVQDNNEPASSGKAKVRFVQASSSLSSSNLSVVGGSMLFSGQAYRTASGYSEISAGTYTLAVTEGSNAAVLASASQVNFAAGKSYTVYTSGTTATGSLSLKVSANN